MSNTLLLSLLIPLMFIAVTLFWLSVVWMIGQFGAWNQFAQRYGTERGKPTGNDFRWKSVRFGWLSNYSNSVDITISFEGIYLRPISFFRIGHKPLLIPWDDVAGFEVVGAGIFSNTQLNIQPLDGSKPKHLTLYGKAIGESIRRNAPLRDEFV